MPVFLYKFFHTQTTDRTEGGLARVPTDRSLWPEAWTTRFYKTYALFKSIPLPAAPRSPLRMLVSRRRSNEKYLPGNKVTVSALSHILKCGYGLQEDGESGREENRTVPSAGMRYPLEVYVFFFKPVGECATGIYHYDIRGHSLEPVMFTEFTEDEILSYAPQQHWLTNATGMICLTGVFGRTVDKYGSRGYRYILLEAGHVAQNMVLAGTEENVCIVPMGGTDDDTLEAAIGLGTSDEKVMYTLAV